MVWPIRQVGITAGFFCTEMVLPIDTQLPVHARGSCLLFPYVILNVEKNSQLLYFLNRKSVGTANVENSLYIYLKCAYATIFYVGSKEL